jgi:hypothetical protein
MASICLYIVEEIVVIDYVEFNSSNIKTIDRGASPKEIKEKGKVKFEKSANENSYKGVELTSAQ